MKQINSKIKMHSASILNNNIERLVLNIMLWSFAALALWYVLILGNMVSSIVERRTLETNARTLSNEVADLELTYLSVSNNIDLNLSHSLGFKETKAKFATRKSLGSIKLAKNEI